MSNYSVKSGDNLWNIVKREFKLTSNADVLKKVREVANSNNLDNPDKLFVGQEINLGNATDTVTLTTKKESENMGIGFNSDNTTNPYLEAAKAAARQRIANSNIKTYEDIKNLSTSSVSLWGDKVLNEEQKEQSYTTYSEQLLAEYYDLNKDGTVTVEEFAQKEAESSKTGMDLTNSGLIDATIKETQNVPELMAVLDTDGDGQLTKQEYLNGQSQIFGVNFDLDGDGNVTEEEYFEAQGLNEMSSTIATRSGNLFAQNLDFNGNGNIDAEELAFFNKEADGCDGYYDGQISNTGESAMFGAVTGMNASNPEYNKVVNKYLSGATLTAEEQQILKDCQATIRRNIGKAAGIYVEG